MIPEKSIRAIWKDRAQQLTANPKEIPEPQDANFVLDVATSQLQQARLAVDQVDTQRVGDMR